MTSEDAQIFLRATDALPLGLVFYTCEGERLYANRLLAARLTQSPGGASLQEEIDALSCLVCKIVRLRELACEEVHENLVIEPLQLGGESLRLTGHYLGLDLFGRGPTVLLTLEEPPPDPLSEDSIRGHFGFSRQESRIARLLAEGRSNQEIAQTLSISPHTARHHTERVMQKMGVKSRAEVAGKLLRG